MTDRSLFPTACLTLPAFAARRWRDTPMFLLLALLTALTPVSTRAAPAMAAGDVEAGKTLFAARCASCHALGPMATSGFGPQLNHIVNRRAGSLPDFDYSTAMKQSGIVWDDRALAAFVADPGKTVPGTKMRFWGIGNERKVADLLAYLHTFK